MQKYEQHQYSEVERWWGEFDSLKSIVEFNVMSRKRLLPPPLLSCHVGRHFSQASSQADMIVKEMKMVLISLIVSCLSP